MKIDRPPEVWCKSCGVQAEQGQDHIGSNDMIFEFKCPNCSNQGSLIIDHDGITYPDGMVGSYEETDDA